MANPTFRLAGGTYAFSPIGGPIDQNPRPQLIDDIGFALMSWSRMEFMLTHIVIHINKEGASKTLYNPDPQSKFTGMVKLLRKWLSSHVALAHVTTLYDNSFFDHLIELASVRNEMTHGFLDAIDPTTGIFTMRVMQRVNPNEWKAKSIEFNATTATELAAQSNLAMKHFVAMAETLFPQAPDEQPQTP